MRRAVILQLVEGVRVLPSVGIRRHRITLTHRPTLRRLTLPRPSVVVGPAIYDSRVDPPRFSHWSAVATLLLLTVLCACVGFVELPHR
jgi:uncharacterized membrane protein (DUF4010 family)